MIIMFFMSQKNENPLDLNLLVTLDALLAERSVTRAARRLGVTQPAVSHRLRALRERLGDPLLVGSRRDLVLTERAKAIAGPLGQALASARSALEAGVSFDPARTERSFVMSTSDLGEVVVVPRVLEFLRAEAPGVKVVIRKMPSDPGEQLASGALELVVGAPLPPQAGLVRQVVGYDDLVVLAREGHPALRRGKVSLASFVEAAHVLVDTGVVPGSVVDAELERRGLRRRVAVQVAHFVAAPFLVARSDLLATVGRSFARAFCEHMPLVAAPHPLELRGYDAIMTWHERSRNDPAHRWFRGVAARMTLACMPRPRGAPRAAS
jgi:DNA-binding transcriptional LysR family regulator